MTKRMALVIQDNVYSKKLMAYMRRHPLAEGWSFSLFTSWSSFKASELAGDTVDLLLVEDIAGSALDETWLYPIAILGTSIEHDSVACKSLKKYQALPQLLRQLMDYYQERSSVLQGRDTGQAQASFSNKQTNIITVYSGSGGSGKSTLAVHLAHAAGSLRERIFLLNMEYWNSLPLWTGTVNRTDSKRASGLSELLFQIKSNASGDNWTLPQKRHERLQFEYMEPFSHPDDRHMLTSDDALHIIHTIAEKGLYNSLIVDLDSPPDGKGVVQASLLEVSRKVVWILGEGRAALYKEEKILQCMEQQSPEQFRQLLTKILFIHRGQYSDLPVKLQRLCSQAQFHPLPTIKQQQLNQREQLNISAELRAAAGTIWSVCSAVRRVQHAR